MSSWTWIAGPCALEDRETAFESAAFLWSLGVRWMRAPLFKIRTCPKSWRGLGADHVHLLADLKSRYPDLHLVTEIGSLDEARLVAPYVSLFQVGTRNAQNFHLIEGLSKMTTPQQGILLKRGMGNTVKEFCDAAAYAESHTRVWLCERGIRTFENSTRNTLDLSVIPVLKTNSSETVIIIDPSHSTGDSRYVPPLLAAAKAAGADGALVEVHPRPERARTDARQALGFVEFERTYQSLSKIPSYDYAASRR